MLEFIKSMSYVDIGLIVIGVLALLIGLGGKAPKRIFHMIFVILAIPATYFVNKFFGDLIYNTIMGINIGGATLKDTIDSLLVSISQYVPAEMVDGLIRSVLIWLEGIACLIAIPLVGDIIVGIFCIKAKKGTAKKTLGLPKLISTAVVWTYLLLPLILLQPMVSQIPGLVSSLSESGILSKIGMSEEVEYKEDDTVQVVATSSNATVLADSSALSNVFGENGVGTIVINQISNSKYLSFNANYTVPAVEKVLTVVEKKEVKLLSYTKDGKTYAIFSELANTLEQINAIASSPLMDIVSDLMENPDNFNATELVESIFDMDKDEAKALFQSVQSLTDPDSMLGSMLTSIIPTADETYSFKVEVTTDDGTETKYVSYNTETQGIYLDSNSANFIYKENGQFVYTDSEGNELKTITVGVSSNNAFAALTEAKVTDDQKVYIKLSVNNTAMYLKSDGTLETDFSKASQFEFVDNAANDPTTQIVNMITDLSDDDVDAMASLVGALDVETSGEGDSATMNIKFDENITADDASALIDSLAKSETVTTLGGFLEGANITVPATITSSLDEKIAATTDATKLEQLQDLKTMFENMSKSNG